MTLKILRPGLLTTVQDLGRYGYQKFGVIVSGAMDPFAHRVVNLLVGNSENEATLEMTLMGSEIEFEEDALIAIGGGHLSPAINGKTIPNWKAVFVRKGSILRFGACRTGCRAYLAVAGGIRIPHVMDSRSTYLRAGLGGLEGRALRNNDIIETGEISEQAKLLMKRMDHFNSEAFLALEWSVSSELLPSYADHPTVRVVRGGQYASFSEESRRALFEEEFRVAPQSDRMGYRLSGPTLELSEPLEMISEAIAFGTVQVPPEGQPIVLMADRQTTGGYPKIAQIATVDLPVMAQAKPGEKVRFQEISHAEAERLYIRREMDIHQLKQGIYLKYK